MDKNYLTSSDMDMMLFVKQKQLTEKCLSTILNSITLDKTIRRYLNAQAMLFSDDTQVLQISLDPIIYLIQVVQIVNFKLLLNLMLLIKVIWVGLVDVELFCAQVPIITWFMITQELSSQLKEFCCLTIVGLATIYQFVLKFHQSMVTIAHLKTLAFWNMKVLPLILIPESCGLFT